MKFKNLILAVMTTALVAMALSFGSASAATYRLGSDTPVSFNPTRKVTKTAAYSVTSADSQVNVTTSAADIVITLPSISTTRQANNSSSFKFLKTDSTAYKVVVTPASGDTVGGESTRYIVNQNDFVVISAGPGRDWSVDYESPYTHEDHEAGTVDFNGLNSTELASSTVIIGTTPYLGIGDAGAEDTKLYFDGAAQDYHMGLDDTDDALKIGLGTAVGTTPALSFASTLAGTFYADVSITGTTPVLTVGDGGAEDTQIVIDGSAQDYYIGVDEAGLTDDLVIGLGSTMGTTPALAIDEDLVTTWKGGTVALAETVAATNVLTVAECGKTMFLSHATEFVTTLPAISTVVAGCGFDFVVTAAASGADYTVITGNSKETKIQGWVNTANVAAACANEDTLTFVTGNNVGDHAEVMFDGLNWIVKGESLTTVLLTCTDEA